MLSVRSPCIHSLASHKNAVVLLRIIVEEETEEKVNQKYLKALDGALCRVLDKTGGGQGMASFLNGLHGVLVRSVCGRGGFRKVLHRYGAMAQRCARECFIVMFIATVPRRRQ
eukprot:XP_001709098.1 Hypothetical protein GL50803_20787 [Giardia lamblia ATCC 50803]